MQKNFNALGLKLKRHKLSYSYNENNQSLQIGKSLNKNKTLILGIILILITLVILFLGGALLSGVNRIVRKYTIILVILPTGSLGVKMIYDYISLSKGNNGNKTFTKDGISIEDGQTKTKFPINNISDIDFKIENDEKDTFEGSVFLIDTDNNNVKLLTLIDNNYKFLKNDLNFITNTIKEHIGK